MLKYTCEIKINRGRDEVIEKFDNIDNMKYWMKGFQSYDVISGVSGEVGCEAKMTFQIGKRKIEMIETITVKDLPREFSGTYDANGVHNVVKNYFDEIDENTTLYKTYQEFHFTGFMKIIGFLFPSAFKKQSMKYLTDFKYFVEN